MRGQIFTVTFVKRDGSVRVMNARTGVHKHLRGGKRAYDPAARRLRVVYDLKARGYRSIPIDRVIELRTQGVRIKGPLYGKVGA